MKKQFIILLAVVASLMVALFLSACSQQAASSAASASADAAASADASASAAEAEASADAEASAAEAEASAAEAEASAAEAEASADASAGATTAEYKGIPTAIPADHAGRTVDMCASCHVGGSGGAAQIPEDHFINGELDGARNQCTTCHLEAAA